MSAAVTVVIAIVEEYFKKYLIIHEYLQLDPTICHDEDLINDRAKMLIESTKDMEEKPKKRLVKDVEWFVKEYKKLVGRSYNFAKRASGAVKKGRLQVFPNTVSEQFVAQKLTTQNYEFYRKKQGKQDLIAAGIVIGALAIIAAIIIIVVLA